MSGPIVIRAAVEALESRRLLTSVVVNSLLDNVNDSNIGGSSVTLREAINYANTLPQGSATITFDPTVFGTSQQTITLTQGVLSLGGYTIVQGPADGVVINANNQASVFTASGQNEIENLTIEGVKGTNGVAVILSNYPGGANLVVNQCVFTNDSAGGYLFAVVNANDLQISNSSFTNDSAENAIVGVISGATPGDITLTNDLFANDSAFQIILGSADVTDSTFTNNTDSRGVFFLGGGSINGCTITSTSGPAFDDFYPDLTNTIISTSTAAFLQSYADVGSNNLVTDTSDGLPDTIHANPLLGTLGNYGGPTKTLPLLPGSPAIGAGSTTYLSEDGEGDTFATITTDQRGEPRTLNGNIDIGAFQSQGFTLTPTSGSGQSTLMGSAFTSPLKVTVAANNAVEPVAGGVVTFTAPASGASATFGTNPITLAADGTGSTTATANGTPGTYNVSAGDAGVASAATFTLTNARLTPTITVTDSTGVFNGLPFTATSTVNGTPNAAVVYSYFLASDTSFQHQLPGAPTNVGNYLVIAVYNGNSTYSAVGAATYFNITPATPTLTLTDAGGVYNGSPYAATGTSSIGGPYYQYFLASDTAFKSPSTTAPTNVGSYVVIGFSPANSNYVQVGQAAYFSITQAASVLTPVATTVAYGGSTTLSTTLKTTGGALLAGRTVSFSVNGKVIGTAVTNASGVASLAESVAGFTPGVYASGISVSFAGDSNSTATSATASLTVLDAPIVSSIGVSNLLSSASVSGSFTQTRTGAAASDFVATVNWGDGNTQTLLVVADLLHPGQFDLVGLNHIYLQLNQKFTVTVTISTVGKFGAVAGATASYVTTIVA